MKYDYRHLMDTKEGKLVGVRTEVGWGSNARVSAHRPMCGKRPKDFFTLTARKGVRDRHPGWGRELHPVVALSLRAPVLSFRLMRGDDYLWISLLQAIQVEMTALS